MANVKAVREEVEEERVQWSEYGTCHPWMEMQTVWGPMPQHTYTDTLFFFLFAVSQA